MLGFMGAGAGFASAGYAFPRSSYVDGFYYTMQNASYAYIWQLQPNVPTVVGFIAMQFAQVPLNLYKDDEGNNGDVMYDHPAAESLRWPTDHYGGDEWREKMAIDYLVYSNAYSVIIMPPGATTATLLHIPAYAVGVRGANKLVPEAYRILYANGDSQIVQPEDMIHWRGTNTIDPRVGWSKMEQLRQIIIEEATRAAANIEFNRNGRVKGGIIKRPIEAPEWSDAARVRFEEDMAGRMKGMYAGKSPVLEEGMDWMDIGVTPRESEIIGAYELSLAAVANIFGLHPALFRQNPGNTDVDKARAEAFKDVLPGHFRRFAEAINLRLIRGTFGAKDLRCAFDWSSKLEGEEDKLQKLTGAAGRPIYTVNEARAVAGKPPLPGGDKLVLMTNTVEVDAAGNPIGGTGKPANNVMPIPDPNTPAQDGSHRQGAPPVAKAYLDLQERIERAAERGDTATIRELSAKMADMQVRQTKAVLSSDSGGALSQPMIVSRRQAAYRRASGYADAMLPVLQRHFERQRRAMVGTAKASGSSVRASAARWDDELASDLRKMMTDHISQEGEVVSARLMGTFDASQTVNFIADGAKAAAHGINQATQRAIDDARAGLKASATMGDAMKQVFDNAKNVRAPEIARTHGTMVASFGAYEAGRQNPGDPGTIRVKEWVPSSTTPTARHANLGGESVFVDTPFSNGMSYPGDPTAPMEQRANCSCQLDVY